MTELGVTGDSPRIKDFFQNYQFHLFDLTAATNLDISSAIMTLSPDLGFSSITVPSMSIENEEIKVGNSPHKKYVVKGSSTDEMTMSRGVRVGDQDFYEWYKRAQYGRGGHVRKKLAIVQLHSLVESNDIMNKVLQFSAAVTSSLAPTVAGDIFKSSGASNLLGSIASSGPVTSQAVTAGATAGAAIGAKALGSPQNRAHRMWILHDCTPTEYVPNGDLDAEDSEVSIKQLSVQPEEIEEYNPDPNFQRAQESADNAASGIS